MAVSEIIGAAVGVILLVVVAYVVVGSTLIAGETVANTQKDLTIQLEARMRTSFTITDAYNATTSSYIIHANITNTGSEIISDFKHMDVIVYDKQNQDYRICTYHPTDVSGGHWKFIAPATEFIHPNELDPGEKYAVEIYSSGEVPRWFQMTTANGVYASAFL
jgi:flagellar protein FlaF